MVFPLSEKREPVEYNTYNPDGTICHLFHGLKQYLYQSELYAWPWTIYKHLYEIKEIDSVNKLLLTEGIKSL